MKGDPNYGWSYKVVCEDPRLYIPHVGKQYRAIDLKLSDRIPNFLEMSELELLLDVCAASLDVDVVPTSAGSATRRLQNSFHYNPTFFKARDLLRRTNSAL